MSLKKKKEAGRFQKRTKIKRRKIVDLLVLFIKKLIKKENAIITKIGRSFR